MKNKIMMLVAIALVFCALFSATIAAFADSDNGADGAVTDTVGTDIGDGAQENDGGDEGKNNSLLSKTVAVAMATVIVVASVIAAIKKPRD